MNTRGKYMSILCHTPAAQIHTFLVLTLHVCFEIHPSISSPLVIRWHGMLGCDFLLEGNRESENVAKKKKKSPNFNKNRSWKAGEKKCNNKTARCYSSYHIHLPLALQQAVGDGGLFYGGWGIKGEKGPSAIWFVTGNGGEGCGAEMGSRRRRGGHLSWFYMIG